MVAKARRNKGVSKQIDICEKKITELNNRITKYKEKVARYQEAMEIAPKDSTAKSFQ